MTIRGRVLFYWLCLGLPATAWAVPGGYQITAGVTGVSGSLGATSAGGLRVDSTLGAPVEGAILASGESLKVRPGLWGGKLTLWKASETANIVFGDSAHPSRLKIPANTFSTDYMVYTSVNPLASPLRVVPARVQDATDVLTRSSAGYTYPINGRYWEVFIVDSRNVAHEAWLKKDTVLALPYPDADNDGVVDGTQPPVRASTLAVWWLDESRALWVKLPRGSVDLQSKTVSAPVRHFSVFTVMGGASFNVGDAFAFPVPWRPSGPRAGAGPGQTGTKAAGITFSNLPSTGKIKIYTLSGDLVRELVHDDGSPQKTWDGKNEAGEDAATGTYIWLIDSAEARKTGKLVIIR